MNVTHNRQTQRDELHKTIWHIANDLRGAVTGWDFKSYVLGMLFYRFVSENLTDYINRLERDAGDIDFDYSKKKDVDVVLVKPIVVNEKGFYIPPPVPANPGVNFLPRVSWSL